MEYMPCGSLAQFLDDDSLRPFMLIYLRIFYELASALAFIHNLPAPCRVVHGDLKPENVLLTSELHCKLSDFGSSQMVALTGLTTSQSAITNKLDMTLAYAPPEKLESLNIKPRKEQDTYSFGMILYTILSGSPPYRHSSFESTFKELIMDGKRPDQASIDELRATLSEPQQQILDVLRSKMRKCWAQVSSDRPSMLDVQNDLQTFLAQKSEDEIAKEAEKIFNCSHIKPNLPNKDQEPLQPLQDFSPKDGRFVQG